MISMRKFPLPVTLLVLAVSSAEAGVLTVAADGSGDYTSIESAVFDAPYAGSGTPVTILVKPGVYEETVYIQRERRAVRLIGEDPGTTVIRFGLHANMPGPDDENLGTFRTPTLTVDADDFVMENITVENTAGPVGQALAMRVDGDRVVFRNCVFKGWQDTLFLNRGRQYFVDCTIYGGTDFIFGGATAFFEDCDIRVRRGYYIAAASTPKSQAYGFVFVNCDIEGETEEATTFLGRPWRDHAATIFAHCHLGPVVKPEGWHNWGKPHAEASIRYAEYQNSGPGAGVSERVGWSRQLSAREAALLRPEVVLAGTDDWNPLASFPAALGLHRLWYRQPAAFWTEALPVGNGSLGGMVYGNPAEEHIQFNEDTLWGGTIHAYHRPGAWKHLSRIRELLRDGKQDEAEELGMRSFMSIPLRQHKYKPFGEIHIRHKGHEDYRDYSRELDLREGVVRVRYTVGGDTFTRETFSSYPDQVLVHRIQSHGGLPLSLDVALTSPHGHTTVEVLENGEILLAGQVDPPDGVRFASRLKVVTEEGKFHIQDGRLVVEKARSLTLILAADTSYVNFRDLSGDPGAATRQTLHKVQDLDFESLKARHLADYQPLYDRVELKFPVNPYAAWPTDKRLENPRKADDDALAGLLFHYGRYLLIASSRPGAQPANLQGIWNRELEPSWGSKYTLNINFEMNYWPAHVTQLGECAEPMYRLIEDLAVSGKDTARAHYNADGWVVHHNTDLWRGTAPINHSNHGIWPTGGAWLSQHLWEHYRYTGDIDFLRDRAYPVMREAALFFTEYLVEDPATGWLISGPSNSPENGGLVMGPAMDHQLIRGLFAWTARAAEILDTDEAFAEKLDALRQRIAPNQIGRLGQLQEWLEDIDDPENDHRHVSHLWGVFPGDEITWGTPDLMEAARQSLLFRGNGGTGWALAWKISLWARFLDPKNTFEMIQRQLNLVREKPDGDHSGAGGVYPNLFDAHPPFQIDGNFGATAGIAEMLLQSHAGEIVLLPALPAEWPDGSMRGLKARGGFILDFKWEDGDLRQLTIRSGQGGEARLRFRERVEDIRLKAGESVSFGPRLRRLHPLAAGVEPLALAGWMVDSQVGRFQEWLPSGEAVPARWDYSLGMLAVGLVELSALTADPGHLAYARGIIDPCLQGGGRIRGYDLEDYNLDMVKPGSALLELYQLYPDNADYREAAHRLRRQLAEQPRIKEGGFWHKNKYPEQMWLDGLFMASPFLAQYGVVFDDADSIDLAIRQILLMDALAHDPGTGLYHHAYDAARAQVWADPETGLSSNFWSRSIGWYAMAVVDVLDFVPAGHPERDALLAVLARVLEGVVKFQDGASGLWWQVTDAADRAGNYLEATASAMFAYTMAKAVNKGYVASSQLDQALEKAWSGLQSHFLDVDGKGRLSLAQCCRVAGLSDDRDGSYAYYLSERVVHDDIKGVAPFIRACVQMHRYHGR